MNDSSYPTLRQTVLDCRDVRQLADFYRELLGYVWRAGCETAEPGEDWLVIHAPDGSHRLAFQQVDRLAASTWPDDGVPQQLHLDLSVPGKDELLRQHERVMGLGGRMLLDEFDDPQEPLRVYADPAGHPFCIFVAP